MPRYGAVSELFQARIAAQLTTVSLAQQTRLIGLRSYSSRDSSNRQPSTTSPRTLPRSEATAAIKPSRVTGSTSSTRRSDFAVHDVRHSQDREALRTAEARETVLRAARTRRLAERQESEREATMAQLERENYQKRYKAASRKWLSTMVALPFFIVTSYYLYGRLFLGHTQKKIPRPTASVDEDDEDR